MKLLKSILFLLLLLIVPSFTSCASVFELVPASPKNVLYVATNGNDSTAWFGTKDRPWATLASAATHAQPGDKIVIGPGKFTNTLTVSLPVMGRFQGAGTNATFIYNSMLTVSASNEVSGFSWFSDSNSTNSVNSGGSLRLTHDDYVHDIVMVSPSKPVSGGDPTTGYNVISNCLFSTTYEGIVLRGSNFFYNCTIQKPSNTSGLTSVLLDVSASSTWIFWSGGSIISSTNSTSDPTNSCGIRSIAGSDINQRVYLQNTTISVPTGGLDIANDGINTNYVLNVTYSQTNSAALIVPFGGFPNTNSTAAKFQVSWQQRINTNNSFLLPAPPGS